MAKDFKVIQKSSAVLSEPRYIVVDSKTGVVLDDAQGYGYTSQKKAYAAYGYKMNSGARRDKERKIRAFLKEYPYLETDFAQDLEVWGFEDGKERKSSMNS